jgi:hypothetical protein
MIDKIKQPDLNWFLGKHFKIGVNTDLLSSGTKDIILDSLNTLDAILNLIDNPIEKRIAMLLFLGYGTQHTIQEINKFIEMEIIKIKDKDKISKIILDFLNKLPEKLSNFMMEGFENE